ncbi:DUF7289 family protein [Natronorubrum thiooxidans]|uniref:Flagellin N-terminal-like domain-containing protein n=1 Tax=Natronorubrum thiooxidans TaxID=308853 RepID=A0A1N7FCU6_9EURY|nr:hypothetical protein [Natronorubrum thiooxidans]SIR98055.1 hypothetical protein SAMN05421752_106197 [Natronorubrum thiooxidans]
MTSSTRAATRSESSADRGGAPIIGIVLLFGMVLAGAMLVIIAAGPLFDALESQSDRERAITYMGQTDQALATATISDGPQPLEVPPDADMSVVDDGSIEVSWYNESADPWSGQACTAPTNESGTLGALEYELDDRTIVHQGGGVWEHDGDDTTVVSDPQIGYDGESLQLQLMQISESVVDGSGLAATADHSKSMALTNEIQATASDCDGSNVAFRIESSYHEGWATFLEDALGEDENPKVDVIHHEDHETVEAVIEDVRKPVEMPTFMVKEDKGIGIAGEQGKAQPSYDDRLDNADNRVFYIETVIKNEGTKRVGQNVTVTVFNESGALFNTSENSGKLGPGQNTTLGGQDELSFKYGEDFGGTLEVGNIYEYSIETEDHQPDDRGSFYYGKADPYFELLDNVETSVDGDNVTITVPVMNLGIEDGDQDVTLEFLGETNTQKIDLNYGAEGTVEWEINKSAIPVGEHEFTITTDENGSEVNGTIEGDATGGDGMAFVVVDDKGAGDDQFVTDDGESFTVSAEVANTYPTTVERDVTLSIPDANVNVSEPKELENGMTDTVDFEVDPDNHDFDHGEVYEYDIQAEGDGLNPNGSFYFGHPGTKFELANGNATTNDEAVTITADLHNTGVDDGEQDVTLDLDLKDDDEFDDDPYAETIDAGTAERVVGENATIELPINRSVLVTGTYDATIKTEDDELEMTFDVDAGIDPGDVELGGVEDANVTVEVLGSQVSSTQGHIAPMTLDVVTNGETEHSFQNPDGGNNINIGPTWQDKSDNSYTHEFTVDEETDLTLRNTRYSTCSDKYTHSSDLPHYSGESIWFSWCEDVPEGDWSWNQIQGWYWVDQVEFGPIDASEDANLQNVRVRSNENNTIPALPSGTDHQLSATEVLEQHDLIENSGDELDIGPGEFVFLFENTESTDKDGIDALWDEAIDAYEDEPNETYDPNFNDLIVYVEVEQAGVDPGKPSITISPGSGEEADVGSGEGGEAGTPDDFDLKLGGDADSGDSPDVGPGDSDQGGAPESQVVDNTGIDIGSDHVVVG